ncbi:MAG: hypothetical protein HC880_11630 [Bacteroidia bacterium]|nr:hypothetical protein [Bacteroidia bacterium]
MTIQISSSNTKKEILEAFDELEKENQLLKTKLQAAEKQVQKLQTELKQAQQPPTAEALAALSEGQRPDDLPPVEHLDQVIFTFQMIEKGLSKAISEVSEKLQTQAKIFANLNQQMDEKKQSLADIYGLAVEEGLLDQLIQEYQETQTSFQIEQQAQEDAWQKMMQEKKQAWEREEKEHQRTIKERDAQAAKERIREQEAYTYQIKQSQAQQEETFALQKKKNQQMLDGMVATKTQEWETREKELREQEKEWELYLKQYEAQERKREATLKKATDEGQAQAQKEAQIKADLLKREVQSQTQVYEMQIKAREETLQQLNQQAEYLAKQTEAAWQQAQTLALRALEGSSYQENIRI